MTLFLNSTSRGDENSSKDQTICSLQIDRLTTEAGCTVILNDHAGKGNQSEKDPLDVIRGSSAKGGDLDAAMILRKHDIDQCFRVDMVHRELPPVEPFVIGWNYPLMELRPNLDADAMKKAKGGRGKKHDRLKLLAFLRHTSEDQPISVTEWAGRANVKRQTLNGYADEFRMQRLDSNIWRRREGPEIYYAEGAYCNLISGEFSPMRLLPKTVPVSFRQSTWQTLLLTDGNTLVSVSSSGAAYQPDENQLVTRLRNAGRGGQKNFLRFFPDSFKE